MGFDKLLDRLTSLVDSMPSFVVERSGTLKQYLRERRSPIMIERQQLRDVLACCGGYTRSIAQVRETLQRELQEANVLAGESYGPYAHIFRYGQAWDASEFFASEPSFDELAAEMQRVGAFQEELDAGRFRIQRSAGQLLVLDARGLRDELAAIPGSVLPVLQKGLAGLARDTCAAVAQRLDAPGFDATILKPFSNTTPSLSYDADGQAVDRHLDQVRAMHELLKQHRVRVSLDEELQVDILQDLAARRRNSLSAFESLASGRESLQTTQCEPFFEEPEVVEETHQPSELRSTNLLSGEDFGSVLTKTVSRRSSA